MSSNPPVMAVGNQQALWAEGTVGIKMGQHIKNFISTLSNKHDIVGQDITKTALVRFNRIYIRTCYARFKYKMNHTSGRCRPKLRVGEDGAASQNAYHIASVRYNDARYCWALLHTFGLVA